jgi:hypothetical protein
MNRILALKKIITLDQAATHLSNVANDPVTVADLLELALQDQLTISLSLSGNYEAAPYIEGASKKAHRAHFQLYSQQGTVENTKLMTALMDYIGFCIHSHDGKTVKLGPDFMEGQLVSGVWDLSMIGVERELVEGLLSARQPSSAIFTGDGMYESCRPLLLRHITDTKLLVGLFKSEDEPSEVDSVLDNIERQADPINLLLIGHNQRAMQQFPLNSLLGIRAENLQKFINQITEISETDRQEITANSNQNATPAAAPDESEIKRLQRTVAALTLGLMKKHSTYNRNGEPNASQLAKLATEHLRDATSDRTPHGFSETTVRNTITAALNACPELKG